MVLVTFLQDRKYHYFLYEPAEAYQKQLFPF